MEGTEPGEPHWHAESDPEGGNRGETQVGGCGTEPPLLRNSSAIPAAEVKTNDRGVGPCIVPRKQQAKANIDASIHVRTNAQQKLVHGGGVMAQDSDKRMP